MSDTTEITQHGWRARLSTWAVLQKWSWVALVRSRGKLNIKLTVNEK